MNKTPKGKINQTAEQVLLKPLKRNSLKQDQDLAYNAARGEAYEVFCISELIKENKDPLVKFITPHFDKSKHIAQNQFENFNITNNAFYYIYKFDFNGRTLTYPLCEFDLIALNQTKKHLNFYEFKAKRNLSAQDSMQIKKALDFIPHILKRKYTFDYTFISNKESGEEIQKLTKTRVISELKDPILIKDGQFFAKYLREPKKAETLPVIVLDQIFNKFDFILHIYKFCLEYKKVMEVLDFVDDPLHIKVSYFDKLLPEQYLVERIYDFKTIFMPTFYIFNTIKRIYQKIEYRHGRFFKDGEVISENRKTYIEIVALRKLIREIGLTALTESVVSKKPLKPKSKNKTKRSNKTTQSTNKL